MPDDAKPTERRETLQHGKTWETTCAALADSNQHALQRWLHGMQTLSGEMSDLAQARFQLMAEGWSALTACRNPEDIAEWHRRLTVKTTEHCAEEIDKFSRLSIAVLMRQPD